MSIIDTIVDEEGIFLSISFRLADPLPDPQEMIKKDTAIIRKRKNALIRRFMVLNFDFEIMKQIIFIKIEK